LTQGKRDYYESYGEPHTQTEDTRVAEELIATSLYLTIIENRQNCILTRNYYIGRLMVDTLNYISNNRYVDSLKLYNILFDNPIRVYFSKTEENASLIVDSSVRRFSPVLRTWYSHDDNIRELFGRELLTELMRSGLLHIIGYEPNAAGTQQPDRIGT